MIISTHFLNDHPERLCYIGLNIGFGNIILTYEDLQGEKRYCLTDTGLLEIFSTCDYHKGETFLITAYPVPYKVAYALYRKTGHKEVPTEYADLIRRMKIHRMAIAQMEGKNLDDYE